MVVAAAAAAASSAAVVRVGLDAHGIVAGAFVAVLVVLSAIDLERRVLPNAIVLPAAAAVLAAQIALFPERALEWVLAGILAALFLFLPLVFYPAGMGMGDVKLALLLGFALGEAVVVALLIGLVAAAGAACVVLLRGGLAARKTSLPFGPFLAAGALAVVFLGDALGRHASF